MGWLGRSIGSFGNDVGTGYDISQQWKQRSQDMAMQAARQKLSDLMGPLQLQELQQRLRQMQQPQAAGIENSATGGISGVTWDPNTGTYKLQPLAPGQPAQPKITTPFEEWKAKNPNAPLEDWFKASQKPPKPTENKPTTEIFSGARWQYDPDKKIQGQRDPTGQYVKLGPAKEAGTGGNSEKTPFELWKAQNPKGTYQDWIQASKQLDRGDATKAVQAVMNAQKSLQSLEAGIQKSNKNFSVWNYKTWGDDPALNAIAQQATNDYEQKRQDAVAKLTDAGMPVPSWLNQSVGGQQGATPPPPAGFVINK